MLYYSLLGGAFLTAMLLVIGFYNLAVASRIVVTQRLEAYTSDSPEAGQLAGSSEVHRGKGLKQGLLGFSGRLGAALGQKRKRQALQQKLIQAGVLMKAEELMGLSLILAVFVSLLVLLLQGSLPFALLLGLLAYFLPGILVNVKKKKRNQALTNQLPEALDIISNGLRAGYSFPQAMSVVGREMSSPVKDEFSRVIRENRMGKPLEEALLNMGDRTDCEDLELFITALIIHKQVGGNLAEVLTNISTTIRERVRIKGEIDTLTAQGRLSAIIILLLPFVLALVLFFVNPEYMMILLNNLIGQILIGYGIVSMTIGTLLIRKIVNINV